MSAAIVGMLAFDARASARKRRLADVRVKHGVCRATRWRHAGLIALGALVWTVQGDGEDVVLDRVAYVLVGHGRGSPGNGADGATAAHGACSARPWEPCPMRAFLSVRCLLQWRIMQ